MAIIECLEKQTHWLEFLQYKIDGGHMSKAEEADLYTFILNEEYLPVVKGIRKGVDFPYPKIVILNKSNSIKKRIVFTYPREENYVLKFMAYLLQEYDGDMMPNLYSFRKNMGVKKGIKNLVSYDGIGQMFSFKVDIQDYFNSVDIDILLPKLQKILWQEPECYFFMERILRNPYAIQGDEIVKMRKGIMAGLPISAFLANVYLMELDKLFWERNILYARYSDDIIVFSKEKEELKAYEDEIEKILREHGLSINSKKRCVTNPGEEWEYLGFSYHQGVIDVSEMALRKLKGKMKRKARAIYRWKIQKGKADEHAVRAYIKYFNRKFFENPVHNEITWCRWYFPVINTDKTLRVIDRYMQNHIRYLVTGKYSKANYNLRYETMKELGYKSLVNEYYRRKKMSI